jgi:hypothetical protein
MDEMDRWKSFDRGCLVPTRILLLWIVQKLLTKVAMSLEI